MELVMHSRSAIPGGGTTGLFLKLGYFHPVKSIALNPA